MENNVISISSLQIILTIGVAIAAFISPIVVALINNRHARLIRKAELEHEEKMKQIECDHALSIERLNATSSMKNQVFLNLIECLSGFYEDPADVSNKSSLITSMYKAALYCENRLIQNNIFNLIYDVRSGFSDKDGKSLERFQTSMESLVHALHFEISGLKPDVHITS